jgi:hypothetical protein
MMRDAAPASPPASRFRPERSSPSPPEGGSRRGRCPGDQRFGAVPPQAAGNARRRRAAAGCARPWRARSRNVFLWVSPRETSTLAPYPGNSDAPPPGKRSRQSLFGRIRRLVHLPSGRPAQQPSERRPRRRRIVGRLEEADIGTKWLCRVDPICLDCSMRCRSLPSCRATCDPAPGTLSLPLTIPGDLAWPSRRERSA